MSAASTASVETDFDAIVIGAGFGGLRTLHELRELGLSARVFEAGTDVGGTWYWNRYPGARTDSEAWVYCMSYDEALLKDWVWKERYPGQEEVQQYLSHVADRFDMRKDIQLQTRITSAIYDENANVWRVTTDAGETSCCTYLITAMGPLSEPQDPPFEGLSDFKGDWYMTARWPKEEVDFAGKRIGLIGTGATGVQVLPIVAEVAEHVTVFQRTPNYVLPGRNHTIEPIQRQAILRDYEHIWDQTRNQMFGFAMDPAGRTGADVDDEELERILERGWETGGFRYIFETFDDMFFDGRVNDAASELIRKKIRAIVHDPETAETLCPDYPLLARRPPLGHFYFESFNRDNVELVDVSDASIERITGKGVLTGGVEHEFDILVFAVGFDAVTGALMHMDLRGRGGQTIKERWANGPETYLGQMVDGFPNMFMICGPQSPFANIPVIIEGNATWVGKALTHMRDQGLAKMEPKREVVERWREHMTELVNATVLRKGTAVRSWFLGANIPGKPHVVLFYFGGTGAYLQELNGAVDREFTDFVSSEDRDREVAKT